MPSDAPEQEHALVASDMGMRAQEEVGFASFLERTLSATPAGVRKLAEDGPSNWSTRVKDATYSMSIVMRDVGIL